MQALEAGQANPTLSTLLKVAHVLGIPMSELTASPRP
ncbi:helix-turn-helix domain-containing protein [Streptomyces sp. NPDC002779]